MQSNKILWWIICSAALLLSAGYTFYRPVAQLYRIKEGRIHFKSEAPLELIEASSAKLKGLIKTDDQTFAFSVANESFEGFNSALQREHFNENYMESTRYPNCTFAGKIIEPVDFSKDGTYTVRAKGKLAVHGVEVERIIKSALTIKGGIITIQSEFIVPLQEHNITIPKIVYQKIAEEISVEINATLTPQQK
ncbi:YceI family protein [Pontibacter sp. BT213]|uniref:YceI family protein n=2 Tax=Pontibacter fetidus TaxID=2700082 RepID=A0A6B2H7Y8_9BACT|nr:YceI family protein [Pontibacter fetidus]